MDEHERAGFGFITSFVIVMAMVMSASTDWSEAHFGDYFINIVLWLMVLIGFVIVVTPSSTNNEKTD
ncbi:MAG: hypothetical protein KTR16_11340 [Acidiferrobacterales bacterium]|nr:hypothetical protein [Acidiferrobacterales bacterium]